MSAMTPDEVRAARRSVDQMLQSPALKTAEGQSQLLMSIKDMRDILEQSEDLLDHIDAMAAREAKLRELHRLNPPRWEDDYSQNCEHCFDGSYTQDHRTWPCPTIKILDGIE